MLFLDTNILVYAIDLRDARKQSIAAEIVERAIAHDSECVISVQTLSEFANVALAKLKKPIDEVRAFVEAVKRQSKCDPSLAVQLHLLCLSVWLH